MTGGRWIGYFFENTVPTAKPIAPHSAMMMPGSFSALAAMPLPPMIEARPAKAITSPSVRSTRRPLPEHGPGDQRGPDRHGVGDQRRLARRQPEQRQPHQHHPAGDVEDCGGHQARPDRARDLQAVAADQRQRGQQRRAEHAGDPAQRQRRQLTKQELCHRPIEAPADRGDRKEHQAGRGDARSRIPASRIKHVGNPAKSRSAWRGFAPATTTPAGMPALSFRTLRESRWRNPGPQKYTCPVNSGVKAPYGHGRQIFSVGNP